MLLNYLPILFMVGYVAVMAAIVLLVSSLFRPQNPYSAKLGAWECGMEPVGEASIGHTRVHFFLIAILFIVFDVETLFLFPWAVILTDKSISVLIFIEMFIFLAVLAIGFVYAWGKGALDWMK